MKQKENLTFWICLPPSPVHLIGPRMGSVSTPLPLMGSLWPETNVSPAGDTQFRYIALGATDVFTFRDSEQYFAGVGEITLGGCNADNTGLTPGRRFHHAQAV